LKLHHRYKRHPPDITDKEIAKGRRRRRAFLAAAQKPQSTGQCLK